MLDTFRENARSWLIQTLIAAISLVFILEFGPGSRGCRSIDNAPSWSAKVNGITVPLSDFQTEYARYDSYGFKPEQMQQFHVRENIMKELVNEELLAQQAEKNGIYVGNDELGKEIQKAFTFDGKFDEDYYRNYLRRNRNFEDRERRRLMARHMRALAQDSVTVSEEDIKTQYMKEEESASINYVAFRPAQFASKVQVTDADIDKVLKDRAADIQKKYDASPTAFMEPRAMKAQRILVPVKQNATKDEEDAAKKKVDDALEEIKGGKSFDEVAKQFSDTDLGWVSQGQSPLDRTTEENIFKLKPGSHSEVIRAPIGYEVLQVTEDRPQVQKKLEAVQRDIAKDLAREEKMKDMAKTAAADTLAKLKAGTPLAEQWPAPKDEDSKKPSISLNPEAKSTDEFHPNGGIIDKLGSVPKVSAAAFSLTADKRIPDAPIEDQNAFWVIELRSRTRADMAKLDTTKKDELRKQLQDEKRREMLDAWIESLRKNAKIEENQALLSYEHHVTSSEPSDEG